MRRLCAACEVGLVKGFGSIWAVIVIATSARTGVPSIRNRVYLTVALVRKPWTWSSCGFFHLNWTSGGLARPPGVDVEALVGFIQFRSVEILGVTSPCASENASKNRLVVNTMASVPPYCCWPPSFWGVGTLGTATVCVSV